MSLPLPAEREVPRRAKPRAASRGPLTLPAMARPSVMLRAMRPWQWAKNLLLFVPLALAHELTVAGALVSVGILFVAMCACCSAVYLLNDLADVDADRRHPLKRHRPF